MEPRVFRPGVIITLILIAFFWAGHAARPAAHEIPASVLVQAFAKPEGQRLRLLLRVPLVSMRDFNFPARPGVLDTPMLDLNTIQPMLVEATELWIVPAVPVFEGTTALEKPAVTAVRISLPSDRSFESYDQALAHFSEPPISASNSIPTTSALLDVLLDYKITSDRSRFSIDWRLARLGMRVVTSLRFQIPGEPERAFSFAGDPGLVRLDPSWFQAASTFVRFGFDHILDGIDHLLFLFCLVLPLRRFWQLVGVVTSFTVAHSITLFVAAFGYTPSALWFPPLIESLIALSIVYMAIENIVVWTTWWPGPFRRSGDSTTEIRTGSKRPGLHGRWMIAFAFGLVHGFGFSFALQETLQFAGSHLVASLFAFNIGVELGQLLVLLLVLPALSLLFRFVIEERVGIVIASALVLHTAWHWLTERASTLRQYDWSITNPSGLATLLRVTMVVVAVAGVVWIVRARRRR